MNSTAENRVPAATTSPSREGMVAKKAEPKPAAAVVIKDPIVRSKSRHLYYGASAALTVTHNMQQAARGSDWTAFLYEGALIEFGRTRRLFTRPSKKETEDYITGWFG